MSELHRSVIDIGIDLGTTNSALAVFDPVTGDARVVKNNDGSETTPSAVWMPRSGVLRVGAAAVARRATDPDNVHTEFKLELGQPESTRVFTRSGVSMTPIELSAEVLKSVLADVRHRYDAEIGSAVITVPASFRLPENHATGEAAGLAALPGCPLLQEPTAAAFAFDFHRRTGDGTWLVFDLGGGTFDAAIVSASDGELRVLDHAGDPHLGGRDIDWAVVETLLAPQVAQQYGLADFTRANPTWRTAFALLKHAAEEAKIQLSRTERFELDLDLILSVERRELFSCSVSRGEVDAVARPYYRRAVSLCRTALRQAGLHRADVEKVLLVGGSTLSPGLRELLADPTEGLGISLDHSQDPTTAVARGAAVFASTQPRRGTGPAGQPTGTINLTLNHPRTSSLDEVPVSGRLAGLPLSDWSGYRVELSEPDGRPPFSTGQLILTPDGTFSALVPLQPSGSSRFTATLTDARGRRQPIEPEEFTITRWENELGSAVLTGSLGIGLASREFASLLAKGTRLPTVARRAFSTTVPLRRDADDTIRIPVAEGERRRADRNQRVGEIVIRSCEVPFDLPVGTEVEIVIAVDDSRRVSVTADVPLIGDSFEAQIDLTCTSTATAGQIREQLDDLQARVRSVRSELTETGATPGPCAGSTRRTA